MVGLERGKENFQTCESTHDKCQIIVAVFSAANGDILPFQIIFQGFDFKIFFF